MSGLAFARLGLLLLVLWLSVQLFPVEPALTSAQRAVASAARPTPPAADVLDQAMQPSSDVLGPSAPSEAELQAALIDLPESTLPRVRTEPFRPERIQTEADDPYSELAVATDAQAMRPLEVAPAFGPDEQWIDVNLSEQRITAYVGAIAVHTNLVSSGLPMHPTVTGRFYIYLKITAQRMKGGAVETHDFYDLPNVPNVMYFYEDYGIHGAYWHHNFGHPMSHGCVNLPLDDAQWFFDWAPVGTLVLVHD